MTDLLKAEGVEAISALWAISRELDTLCKFGTEWIKVSQ